MQLNDINLTAEQVMDIAKKYLIETAERFPFLAVKAKGMYIYDDKGEAYLDFFGGIAVNSAGNCNDEVVAAVQNQVADMMHVSVYPYSISPALLAELVCKASGMDKIFYQGTGAEANEAMIKMARKYGTEKYGPERYHIVTALKSFHGRTYASMTATGQPDGAMHQGFRPLLPGFTYAPFNNLEAFKAACTENTIAIMLEPCQGEGGVIPATKEFMTGIRKFCDEKGILLLLDEVQTGVGRTGEFMGYMNFGIKPDIATVAKAIGGGLPLGAVLATEELAAAFTPGSHGSTYSGNPVCCAAGYAAVKQIIDKNMAGNAKEAGDYFAEKLKTLPHVKEVRHMGLLVGVEFDIPKAVEMKREALSRKLLTTAVGTNIIRMLPPLIVTKEECDQAYDILKATVEAVAEER